MTTEKLREQFIKETGWDASLVAFEYSQAYREWLEQSLLLSSEAEKGEKQVGFVESKQGVEESSTGEENQCDGCKAGRPLKNGLHCMDDSPYPSYMVCQKDKYTISINTKPAPAAPDKGEDGKYDFVLPESGKDCYHEETPDGHCFKFDVPGYGTVMATHRIRPVALKLLYKKLEELKSHHPVEKSEGEEAETHKVHDEVKNDLLAAFASEENLLIYDHFFRNGMEYAHSSGDRGRREWPSEEEIKKWYDKMCAGWSWNGSIECYLSFSDWLRFQMNQGQKSKS